MDKIIFDLKVLAVLIFAEFIAVYRATHTDFTSIAIIALFIAISILTMSIILYFDWSDYDN